MADSTFTVKDAGTVGLPEEWTMNPLAEMEESQEQVGMLLELAYLALKDHPKVAKEVRISAHTARSQHMMTLGLTKTYVVTTTTVLKEMIPMMRTAVKIKNCAFLKPMFEKVLKYSEDMRKETEEARQSYIALQTKIQKDTADVNTENTGIEIRSKEIAEEKKIAEKQKRVSEEKFKQLEEDRTLIERELEIANNERYKLLQQAVSVSEDRQQLFSTFMRNFMTPRFQPTTKASDFITVAFLDVARGFVTGVFGTLAMTINTIKESLERKQAFNASKQELEVITTVNAERIEINRTIKKEKKVLFDAKHKMQMLDLEASSFGDLESLMQTSGHLANIDEMLLSIQYFWNNLSAFILAMNQKGQVVECFIDATEQEDGAAKIMEELVNIDQGWTQFGVVCSDYAKKADKVIPRIFGFLSKPIDNMSIEERKQRSAELFKQINGTLPAKAFKG